MNLLHISFVLQPSLVSLLANLLVLLAYDIAFLLHIDKILFYVVHSLIDFSKVRFLHSSYCVSVLTSS